MEKAYMGVSINNFLMNIKPWFFKQKEIIIFEIILIVCNVFLHMFGCYNIVVSLFLISMALLIVSIMKIYETFLGTERINEEIEAYLNAGIEENLNTSNKAITQKLNRKVEQKFEDFCRQWKKEISLQTVSEYKEYLSVFKNMFLFLYSDNEGRNKLLSCCDEICRTLFISSGENSTLRSLQLIRECYRLKIEAEKKGTISNFPLLSNVLYDLESALLNIDITSLERHFLWNKFVLNIIQSYFIKNNQSDDSSDIMTGNVAEFEDFMAVKKLCSFFGRLCADNAPRIDKKLWGSPLNCNRNGDLLFLIELTRSSSESIFINIQPLINI
ncbi:MAG: hypothetical protein LKE64_03365 [Solobacterium sp.]|jgi:hypothetical protein|nr:hypothetical protein [Solobacterium sp.]MCH4049520.1 hypothetical protein [Solobacterium sp.]MCH4073204.1 hypothetical protein [Solobacterium sp.]